jgi:hypothetical protein
MKKSALIVFAICFLIFSIQLIIGGIDISQKTVEQENGYKIIYTSKNLTGHQVIGECNPGGGSNCSCDEVNDVLLESFEDFGQVTSNPRENYTNVNAIGYKKFTDIFPDGTSIKLGYYKYRAQFKISQLPAPNIYQKENPEAVQLMIQLWDGRDHLYESNKNTLEATILWYLNPWDMNSYGKIQFYTNPLILRDTGIELTPDTLWHELELVVDLTTQSYRSLKIDTMELDLTDYKLAIVSHPEWDDDVSFIITTESLATWPQYYCSYVFKWSTQFKDLELSKNTPPYFISSVKDSALIDSLFTYSAQARDDETSNLTYDFINLPEWLTESDSVVYGIPPIGTQNFIFNIVAFDGLLSDTLSVSVTVENINFITHSAELVPNNFYLSQNYPNPFNATTKIRYGLHKTSPVRIVIYNLAGELVAELVNEIKPAGQYSLKWDASNFPTGIYFIKMEAGEYVQVHKGLLVK